MSFLTKPLKNCVSRQESIFSHRCPQLRMVWLTCEGDTQVQSLHLFLKILGKSPQKRLGRCPKKMLSSFWGTSLYKSLLDFESLIKKRCSELKISGRQRMAWRCTLQAVAGLTLNFVNEEHFIVLS